MHEKSVTIYIQDLEISDRCKRFLVHLGLMKLSDLLNCDMAALTATYNMSADVLRELNRVVDHADDIIGFYVIDSGGFLPVTENAQFECAIPCISVLKIRMLQFLL